MAASWEVKTPGQGRETAVNTVEGASSFPSSPLGRVPPRSAPAPQADCLSVSSLCPAGTTIVLSGRKSPNALLLSKTDFL